MWLDLFYNANKSNIKNNEIIASKVPLAPPTVSASTVASRLTPSTVRSKVTLLTVAPLAVTASPLT